jgi:hypothetical protein
MKIIGTNGIKVFKIIPREYINGNISVKITNESTNVSSTTTESSSTTGDYMTFTSGFGTLVEDNFYTMVIEYSNKILYKDKLFCTNQAINQTNNDYYTINKNQYTTENSYDNDYVII